MSVVSVVLEGPAADGPAEDDFELRSVVALTAGRSLFHLVSGSLVLFHALLLPSYASISTNTSMMFLAPTS